MSEKLFSKNFLDFRLTNSEMRLFLHPELWASVTAYGLIGVTHAQET